MDDRLPRHHREPYPACQVAAVRVMTHLAAVAEDVQRILTFEHLLAQVGHDVAHGELDVPAHHLAAAHRSPLADPDTVERTDDRDRQAVLLVRAALEILCGTLLVP